METLDELRKELNKWTIKQVESHNERVKLMPPVANLSAGEPLIPWMPTPEILAEYDRLVKTEIEARDKCREIIAKMVQLRGKTD